MLDGGQIKGVGAAKVPQGVKQADLSLMQSTYTAWLDGPFTKPGKRPNPPESAAVDLMTINPAKVLGLDKRIGSLEAKKDADLFITDGDVLDPRHHVLATFIDGFCVYAG